MNIRLYAILFLIPFAVSSVNASGDNPPCRLVDTPTAGCLAARQHLLESHLFDGGGMNQHALFGVNDRLTVGLSYGGSNLIGSEQAVWQPHAGFNIRVRLIEESMSGPALSLGFDSQGEGPYLRGRDLKRFRYKSRGAYVVLSRNYRFWGNLGVHGGVNYSLETADDDIDPSFWAGFDKSLGKQIDMFCEYDFALNDGRPHDMAADRGYLNTAITWRFGKGFRLEFDLRNILFSGRKNIIGVTGDHIQPSREIRFSYTGIL